MAAPANRSIRVVFLHPDLGIGGAERLVVDAGLALKSRGHDVTFVTAHHDNNHCFPETKQNCPRPELKVITAGDFLPRSLFGRCYAVCAYLRMFVAALYLVLFSGLDPQVVICDQISFAVPWVKYLSKARVVFYCHFPDQLLTQRDTMLKSLYRRPIDYVEEKTTGMADTLLVNSKFTAAIFRHTFKTLSVEPEVLYPSLNTDNFDRLITAHESMERNFEAQTKTVHFLSINRYERKKNLPLAIRGFALLHKRRPDLSVKLTMAGGYDTRVIENVEHFLELKTIASDLGVSEHVSFLKSPEEEEKISLLCSCSALVYTPSGEHFGIVPIEAMYCGVPVVAVNDGGPRETVVDGETGFLRAADPEEFADAMESIAMAGNDLQRLGASGKRRVEEEFSFSAFTAHLDNIVRNDH